MPRKAPAVKDLHGDAAAPGLAARRVAELPLQAPMLSGGCRAVSERSHCMDPDLALSFMRCMTLDILVNLPAPQFPYIQKIGQ